MSNNTNITGHKMHINDQVFQGSSQTSVEEDILKYITDNNITEGNISHDVRYAGKWYSKVKPITVKDLIDKHKGA